MSKLDELIEELCPDGVEYKLLGDLEKDSILELGRGKVISKKTISDNPGKYPVYSSSAIGEGLMGKYNQYMFDEVLLSWSVDGGGRFFYRNKHKFSLTNVSGWLRVLRKDVLNIRYLYYVMDSLWLGKTYDYVNKAHPSVIKNDYLIPLPPLPVQQEIVRILDNFTELTAELKAELTARRKQYEYYRDLLLTFGDEVEWKTLDEIARYAKSRIEAREVNADTYVGVDNLLPDKMGKTTSNYVPLEGRLIKYDIGDILIGNIRPYLKKIWLATDAGGTNGDVLVIRINDRKAVLPKYLYFVLSSDNFFVYNMQNAKGAKMPRGDKTAIMKYPIPVPPLEEQERIVAILDCFDALCNDLTSGIPAEIEARQKQYEYYRDKLLSFKEVTA